MSEEILINPELLETETETAELVTLRLRVEAEMTAEPEIIKGLAPHLSSALIALLYQHDELRQTKGRP